MPNIITRAANLVIRPEHEWRSIEREGSSFYRILAGYLAPLALIAPLAHTLSLLIAGESALRGAASGVALGVVLRSIIAGLAIQVLGVLITAAVVYLVMPLYRGARDYDAALRLVSYAATPVWLAGIVLVVPLERFPLLTVGILIALMHASYLFYLGLHQLVKVPLRDAAECAAIVVLASLVLSTALGYAGSAAGLLPQM
jgi:hypothetical protein